MHVNRETLLALTQESLEKSQSIQRLEEASGELYKALLAGRDNGMRLVHPAFSTANKPHQRYGGYNGKIGRVSYSQSTVLQANAGFLINNVYCSGMMI